MKKAIFVIIFAMLLTSCRVGPEEKPKEARTEPIETATEPIAEMIVPEPEPVEPPASEYVPEPEIDFFAKDEDEEDDGE